MKFFLNEILENEEIRKCLQENGHLADEGKKIAAQIATTGECISLDHGILPIFVLGYLADYALEKNSARGIPREITVDTLKDVNVWFDNYQEEYGKLGLAEFGWLFHHYTGRLFRLGRLQFAVGKAPVEVPSGEYVLETHIPQGEPLDSTACLASFESAKVFFAKYFPETPAQYFTCHSWLLCPNLAQVADEDSNIVRFMRLWQHYPCASDHSAQTVQRVFGFGVTKDQIAHRPVRTRLQKRVQEYLLSGGDLSACAGYRV